MKGKSILKVLILFLLGMALGAFVMGWHVNRRLHRIHQHQAGKGFSEVIIHFTNVEGKEKEDLLNLSSKYGTELDVLRKDFEQEKIEILNKFEAEANLFLSESSKERLKEHLKRLKRGPKHKGKKKN